MNQNQTESKPPSVEEPRSEGLDGTHCSRSSDTPETDAYGYHPESDSSLRHKCEAWVRMAQKLERERNDARARLAAIQCKSGEALRISWLYSGRDVVMGIVREIEELSSENV